MWTAGLRDWFDEHGRHSLPWRNTTDPWAVLVSEVMLQQTSVGRVLVRWEGFMTRWPAPDACAAASLDDVLRAWQGLGYPRRARALWLVAARVSALGWPADEAGLRTLPGVGVYTARALLAFSDLAGDASTPPRDVNLGRVAARASLGREPHEVRAAELDTTLRDGRPASMSVRKYTYALFDVGAIHCRARPQCSACPLRHGCAWRARGVAPASAAHGQPPYRASLRQLRGAVLSEVLRAPGGSSSELAAALHSVPGVTADRIRAAIDGLVEDGLIPGRWALPS